MKNKANLIIKPNTSLKNKTGSWRTKKPVFDHQTCIGCSLCSKLCPEACIIMKQSAGQNKPFADYDYCKGCGLCVDQCPVKAIKMTSDF